MSVCAFFGNKDMEVHLNSLFYIQFLFMTFFHCFHLFIFSCSGLFSKKKKKKIENQEKTAFLLPLFSDWSTVVFVIKHCTCTPSSGNAVYCCLRYFQER